MHGYKEIVVLRQFVEVGELSQANSLCCFNGFFTLILNNQMLAIDYVLLSNDMCMGVECIIIDEEGLIARYS
jgi:hypothetical protein